MKPPRPTCWLRLVGGFVVLCAAIVGSADAAKQAEVAPVRDADTSVGMEGVRRFQYTGRPLEAIAADEHSPLTLRITTPAGADSREYEVRDIGVLPGDYDLRDYLTRVDGQPLAGVPPLPVHVGSVLPDDHDGTIDDTASVALPWYWPYRWLLAGGLWLWLLPICWRLARIMPRPQPVEPALLGPPRPTLAEQLGPLVDAALADGLDARGRARLESLLYAELRRRHKLVDPPTSDHSAAASAMEHLSRHPARAVLMRQLQTWLYAPPAATGDDDSHGDVTEMLAPFRSGGRQDRAAGHASTAARRTTIRGGIAR